MEKRLLKYIKGDCVDEEKAFIAQWLDADPKNMKEYLVLRRLFDIAIWQTNPTARIKEKPNKWSGKRLCLEVLKIVAVLIIAIFVAPHFLPIFQKSASIAKLQTLHVPAGQRAEITLADGTHVWLNAETTLTFPTQFSGNSREVKIDGEGFFDVTPDKSNPFIVNTEKYNVKVWGTQFNLQAYSGNENFETSLLQGSIEILLQGNTNGVLINPGERIYLKDGQMVIARIENRDHFLWREGIISFDDAPFTEIVSQLEFYFDLDIEVLNNKILNDQFTGKFRMKDGVEHILKVLQLKSHFTYLKNDDLNTIKIQ